MNSVKKAYCRSFQQVFRMVLPMMPFRQPKRLNSFAQAAAVLNQEGHKSVLIVTDPFLYKQGMTLPLEQELSKAGVSFSVYSDTQANPTLKNVEEALKIYKSSSCSALISIGGGSSIDTAKALGARVVNPNRSLNSMKGILKVFHKLPLHIAIPTTAGTGSETTLAAVVVDDKTRHKYAITDFPLIPDYALLDPTLTLSMPFSLTASTGMDALTHAIEAYIGKSTTRQTRKYALEAVKLIFENLEEACLNGANLQARKNMLEASYKAGCAFTRSYVGYVHAAAHALGGKYNTPHGFANAVLLDSVLELYGKAAWKPLKEIAVYLNWCAPDCPQKQGAELFIRELKKLKKKLGIPNAIRELEAKDIPELAIRADQEANPLYPVPRLMDEKELREIFYGVLESKWTKAASLQNSSEFRRSSSLQPKQA